MTEKKESFLGVDLGGTKLLIGEVDRDGNILRTARYSSANLSKRETIDRIREGLAQFMENALPDYTPKAIGVGMIGRIDNRLGIWHEYSPESKESIPVAEILSQTFGLPCFVDNDTRSAARAEQRFGSSKNCRDFLYINIGTGIAAGIVCGGQLLRGGHHNAGEVGHTGSGVPLQVPCFCGRKDCVEAVASGSGLDKAARMLRDQYPDTALPIPGDGTRVNAGDIFRLSESDALCRYLTDNAAAAAANLIMNLVRCTDPERVVLGGGVVADGFLYRKILDHLSPYTMRYVSGGVVLTELDPRNIGLLGACSNAMAGMEDTL